MATLPTRVLQQSSSEGGEVPGGVPGSEEAKDWLLVACRGLNVLTASSLALCALALGTGVVFTDSESSMVSLVEYVCSQIVRVYGIVVCLSLILVETEFDFVLHKVPLLDKWVIRGLVYGFVASLTYKNAEGKHRASSVFRAVASISLLLCSLVYVVGGILCIGRVRRIKKNRTSEIEHLEQRRRELQRLLGRSAETSAVAV